MSIQNRINGDTEVAENQTVGSDIASTKKDGCSSTRSVPDQLPSSSGGRGPKSKKKSQKTYTLSEMFFMHEDSMGNWADAAVIDNVPPIKVEF